MQAYKYELLFSIMQKEKTNRFIVDGLLIRVMNTPKNDWNNFATLSQHIVVIQL